MSSQNAADRMAQSGPNELTKKIVRPPWLDFLVLFTNPLAIILLIAAAISRLVGETFDATLIATLVLLGATIDLSSPIARARSSNTFGPRRPPRPQYCEMASGKNFPGANLLLKTSFGSLRAI